eukprot:TRINITY_DN1591_c0_g1_i1.p1 TRINITY_DN1591_c0_g1~~TRINITY_DN1591_c0_g1_i1.p1  ORF type:complete len:139 (-),score=27.44 TRINITY_DN1591_c0_g1_i1:345-761(-)
MEEIELKEPSERRVPAPADDKLRLSRDSQKTKDSDEDEDVDENLFPKRTDESSGPNEDLDPAPPWRVIIIAAFLTLIGLAFTPTGIVFVYKYGWTEATPFLTVGGVTLIPGLWATIHLLKTWYRYPGYRYDQLPRYDS